MTEQKMIDLKKVQSYDILKYTVFRLSALMQILDIERFVTFVS